MMIRNPALDTPGIAHAFFTREGGVSDGIYASLNGGLGSNDSCAAVQENRRRMADCLGVRPENLVSLYQVHSPDVVVVEGPWLESKPKADGMVTVRRGVGLAISTADCGPVLFADPEAGVIGACHAGWKGALGGVLEGTLEAMERLGASRPGIVAVLGPTISAAAYETGPEFVDRFVAADSRHSRFFSPSARQGHAMFDLPAFIRHRMAEAGVGRFADVGRCTYSDEQSFFSYRRATHRGEPDYGRLVSAIAFTP